MKILIVKRNRTYYLVRILLVWPFLLTVRIPVEGRWVKLLVFRPGRARKPPDQTPAVLWLHGGGYATGMAEMFYFTRAKALVKKFGAVVAVPAYTYVGDIEPFYCETLAYIENLKKAGIDAHVDIYPGWFHAYDLYFPFTKKGKRAIRAFEEQFCKAVERQ